MIKSIPKRWGKEEWIINDEYCGKVLHINKGKSSSIHYHKKKKETLFILSGVVKICWYPFQDYIKNKKLICEVVLRTGQSFTLYPNTVHRFDGLNKNNKILELSTHYEESDVYKIREK